MSKDKRAEIVEAMARELLGRVNAPEQEIYRVAGDLADIALKAAAEIADGFRCGACGMDGAASAAILALLPEDAAGLDTQKDHSHD